MTTNSDLKPCPFCKAGETRTAPNQTWTGRRYLIHSYTLRHICVELGVITFTRNTEAEVIAAWNCRTSDSEAELEVKGVEKALAVVSAFRENICPGGLSENRQYEESIVQPHLDSIADELENLIVDLREGRS